MQGNTSEVARFREQQEWEEQAVLLGFSGFALTARHDFIETRAQRGAERILQLLVEGQEVEALRLMNEPGWGLAAATMKSCSSEEENS